MNQQLSNFCTTNHDNLRYELENFCALGTSTVTYDQDGISYFVNEFWTARQRQAHKIQEISYRACFKPQLPAFFIERLSRPGDVVYDPFMGRGTTPIEAALRDRVPYGNDTNPLSRALTEPRINSPTASEIASRLSEIAWDAPHEIKREDLRVFYHPTTLTQIEKLKSWLRYREETGCLDQVDRWIRMVAINRLTGHSSGFFSVYTLPPNQAVSVDSQIRINAKRSQIPPLRDVPSIINKKSKQLLSAGSPRAERALFTTCQAHDTREIRDGSVTLTVTSPPFLDIVNYEADNWLRCWFMGVDPMAVRISSHRRLEDWTDFVRATLGELARVTRSGGHIAFEVGEVRSGRIQLEKSVISAADGLPLEVIGVMINQQEFTKTSNCWGVENNRGGTNSNRIVIFGRS